MGGARAEIKTRIITYKDGDVTLKGIMAWDGAKSGKHPGVLVIGEWWGLNDANKNRTRRLAAPGYVAFFTRRTRVMPWPLRSFMRSMTSASEWVTTIISRLDACNSAPAPK